MCKYGGLYTGAKHPPPPLSGAPNCIPLLLLEESLPLSSSPIRIISTFDGLVLLREGVLDRLYLNFLATGNTLL